MRYTIQIEVDSTIGPSMVKEVIEEKLSEIKVFNTKLTAIVPLNKSKREDTE